MRKETCTRRAGASPEKISFEHWLHGGHRDVVKSGLMLPFIYKTYPGLGNPDRRGTVIINPCVQEGELISWLAAKGHWDGTVEKAVEIAKKVHWDQKMDDGSPYLERHIYPVTGMILWVRGLKDDLMIEYTNTFPEGKRARNHALLGHAKRDILVLALLHDVLEKSEMDEEELRETFGDEIYQMVKTLTKKRPWEESYDKEKYTKRIRNATVGERIVKLAERLNNVFCLQYSIEAKRESYLKDTVKWYYPMAAETLAYFHLWYYRTLSSLNAI